VDRRRFVECGRARPSRMLPQDVLIQGRANGFNDA
jgi:hypothetical protein